MKHFYVLLLMAALSMLAGGDSAAVPAGASDGACQALMDSGASKEVLAQQGCCAQNYGVCGCRAGRIVCCDKSFSPNCNC